MSEQKTSRRNFVKYAGGAVAVAAIAAAGYGAYQYYYGGPARGPAGKRKVRIGTTKPLSGIESVLGRNEWEGTQLWAKMVNEAGGIKAGDGNTYEVELVFYDDENKTENVARLFEKLIVDDKVDFLFGPIYGPLGMAAVPVVLKYKKLDFYGTASYDPKIWEKEYGDYIIHTCTNGSAYMASQIDLLMDYIVPKIDSEANKVAIIHGDDIFRYVCGTGGYEYAAKRGVNIVYYEQYSTDLASVDLSPILTKVKQAQPKVLLVGGGYPDAVLTVKQAVELDLQLNMFWPGTGAVTPEWYEAVKPYGEQIQTITQWEPGVIYPVNYGPSHDEYVSGYVEDYGREPEYCSAIGFSQGLALQMAMEKCDDPLNTEAIRETVRKEVEFLGFYGHYKTDYDGIQIGHQVAVMQWQNGRKMCIWPENVKNTEVIYPMISWDQKRAL